MSTLLAVGRFFLLMLSMLGYSHLLIKRLHIHVAFTPAVFCAGVSSVLFAAGVLNLLPLAAFLLFAVGLALFALSVKENLRSVDGLRAAVPRGQTVYYALYLLVLLLFFFHLKGVHYTHYDNFSHWALVVREMLLTDRMPCYKDSLITFQSYPLGSALYIYYVSKILGNSESAYLFAQLMLSVSFLFPLTAFVKKNWQGAVLVLLFGLYALISNVSIYDLLVDTVMPLAAVAAVCLIHHGKTAGRKTLIALAPLMIFLAQVKSSGLFFAAACWLIWLVKNLPAVRGNRRLLLRFASYEVLLPAASLLLWRKHIELVFDSALTTKHAVSFSYFYEQLFNKNRSIIWHVGKRLLAQVFAFKGQSLAIMALVSIIFVILILSGKDRTARSFAKAGLAEAWIIFAAYVFGLFAMYVFSMPVSQRDLLEGLPGFSRYMCSGLLFIFGLSVVHALNALPDLGRPAAALLVTLCLLPVYPCRGSLASLITRPDYQSSDRYRLVTLFEENHVEPGLNYAFYQSGGMGDGYFYYLSRYELRSCCCDWFACDKSYAALREKYNYPVILDRDDRIQAWLASNGLSEYLSEDAAVIELNPS